MVANTLDSSSDDGKQGLPNSATSDNQNVQPPSTPAPTQSPEQLDGLIAKKVSEALQDPNILKGMKDRRFVQLQRQLDDASPILERVKEILTPEQKAEFEQIKRDAEFEDMKRAVYGDRTQTDANLSGNQGGVAVGVEAVVMKVIDEVLELPANDSRVTQLKLSYANDPNAYAREAKKLKASFSTQPPSPAEQLLPEGSNTRKTEKTPAQLEQDYQKEIREIAATLRGDEKIRAIANLKVKYREAGLNKT